MSAQVPAREHSNRIMAGIICGDGRIQAGLQQFAAECGLRYCDVATVPGPDLPWTDNYDPNATHGDPEFGITKQMRKQVALADLSIYLSAHDVAEILFGFHSHCAGCDVTDEEHDAAGMRAGEEIAHMRIVAGRPVNVVRMTPDPITGIWTAHAIGKVQAPQQSAAA